VAFGLGQLARLKLVVLPLNALMLNDNLADGIVDGDEHEKVSSQGRGKEFKDIFIKINVYFIFI